MRKIRNIVRTLCACLGIWIIPEKDWKECAECMALGCWDEASVEYLLGVPRHLWPWKFWKYAEEYYQEYERQMNLAEQSFQS